ncbi:MAG: BPSL0067 family protein [Telluria sp.]
MSYVYHQAEELKGKPKVGNGDCVAHVRAYAPGLKELSTASWTDGPTVLRNHGIVRGTAIATFVDGSYPNKSTGNHACFYVGQAGDAVYVIEQFKSDDPNFNVVTRRRIQSKGKRKDGSFIDPSNNADAFSVIEL